MVGYNLGFEKPSHAVSFNLEAFGSPGNIFDDQSKSAFTSLRPGASNSWLYARGAFTYAWKFYQEWSLHNFFRAQGSISVLPPSEQYGVGGYNTVRGYTERAVNGDDAFIYNLEIRTPSFSILKAITAHKYKNDLLQFLLFFDYGVEHVKKVPLVTENKTEYLVSFGPGVRYNMIPYLNIRVDWGIQLHDIPQDSHNYQLHFSLIAGY